MAFLDAKNRYTFAGDIPSSAAISATAVLAKPSRRNRASAVSIMRARVSSGLVLGCAFIKLVHGLLTDENNNSSVPVRQLRSEPGHLIVTWGPSGTPRAVTRVCITLANC